MKVDQLKNIIKEAVREAVREEIKEILTEAVLSASEPKTSIQPSTPKPPTISAPVKGTSNDPIMEMLNMTQQSMTRDDFKNMMESKAQPGMSQMNFTTDSIPASAPAGPQQGIDISQLSFVKNAAAIYNKSLEKDQFRVGG